MAVAKENPHSNVGESCVTSECHVKVAQRKVRHDFVADGECLACHFVAEAKKKTAGAKVGVKPCGTCHEDYDVAAAKVPKRVHEVLKEGCNSCHAAHDSEQMGLLTDKVPDLCTSCHADVQESLDKVEFKHGPLASKEQCMACHDPHLSEQAYLLKKQENALCFSCHERIRKELESSKFKHGPLAKGDCSPCHQIHEAKQYPKLLKANLAQGLYAPFDLNAYLFCFSCHEHENKGLVLEEKTGKATKFRNGTVNLHYVHVRKDVKQRTCRNCHAAHASNQAALIRASIPFFEWEVPLHYAKTQTGGRCETGCHGDYAYDREKPILLGTP